MLIRSMRAEDLDFAAGCTAAENWQSETRQELETLFINSPQTCLIAESSGDPLGICMGTPVGSGAFIGELIVKPAARGRHLGRRLLEECVDRLRALGAHDIYLDGVPKAVPLYLRAGFAKVCPSHRFHGTPSTPSTADGRIAITQTRDLIEIARLDNRHFGADRNFFLERRLALYPDLSLMLREKGVITAFLSSRPCGDDQLHVGPIIAETPDLARALLEHLAALHPGKGFVVGVLECNPSALALTHELGLTPVDTPPWRMRLGEMENPGAGPGCFAVGSPAKG
ncbi:MAG: GNAT family N-acetyltransferase [bacterium]|nr:GNAT family N-acetyltransferase [bacterium]